MSGRAWPDAAAAGALAAANGWPIVLADGDRLPAASARILSEASVRSTIIVGGTSVLGPSVERALPRPRRIAGANRYSTAALLAEHAIGIGLLADRMVVTSGATFHNALPASVLAGRARAPLLLVHPADATAPVCSYVDRHRSTLGEAWIVGGPTEVSSYVVRALTGVTASR